jgi:hypothetical protein
MSILSQSEQNQPTKEELLIGKVNMIKHFSKQCYQQLSFMQTQGIHLLWGDSELTPQEICDTLGSDAVKIFEMHGILTSSIAQIAAVDGVQPSIALPTNAFEIVDGKIIVSGDPYTA